LLIARELLEQIKDFEEKEFAGVASRDMEFKPRLQPLNESGGSALLKIVSYICRAFSNAKFSVTERTAVLFVLLELQEQLCCATDSQCLYLHFNINISFHLVFK